MGGEREDWVDVAFECRHTLPEVVTGLLGGELELGTVLVVAAALGVGGGVAGGGGLLGEGGGGGWGLVAEVVHHAGDLLQDYGVLV